MNLPEPSPQRIGLEVFSRFQPLFDSKRGGQTKDMVKLRQSLHQEIIDKAIEATENFRQTIRRIYYLCSGLGMVPKGQQGEDAVSDALNDARWSGQLKWTRINDGGRYLSKPLYWQSVTDFKQLVYPQFALDRWVGQSTRVILAFEKDTLGEMLSNVCDKWHVPYVSFHGQSSNTVVHDLAELINSYPENIQIVCLYLGDHDEAGLIIDGCVFGITGLPENCFGQDTINYLTGEAMKRDDEDAFIPYDKITDTARGVLGKLRVMLLRFFPKVNIRTVEYRRLGINRTDIQSSEFDAYKLESLPFIMNKKDKLVKNLGHENYIKKTKGDVRTLGIDALPPEQLIERTEIAIQEYIDFTVWDARAAEIEAERQKL
jgi:hypothetical protein